MQHKHEEADERLYVLEGMLSAFPDRQRWEAGHVISFFTPRGHMDAQSDCSGRRGRHDILDESLQFVGSLAMIPPINVVVMPGRR